MWKTFNINSLKILALTGLLSACTHEVPDGGEKTPGGRTWSYNRLIGSPSKANGEKVLLHYVRKPGDEQAQAYWITEGDSLAAEYREIDNVQYLTTPPLFNGTTNPSPIAPPPQLPGEKAEHKDWQVKVGDQLYTYHAEACKEDEFKDLDANALTCGCVNASPVSPQQDGSFSSRILYHYTEGPKRMIYYSGQDTVVLQAVKDGE